MTGAASSACRSTNSSRLIRDVPKPVIARVNGFAIGGGNVFATLCDLTIAADTAQVRPGRPESRLGRRGLGHRPARPPHRRQAGAGDVVPQRTVHGAAGPRDGPRQQGRARGRTRRGGEGLDRHSRRALADRARARQALVQRRQREHPRHQPSRMLSAVKLFYETEESKEGVRAFKEKRKPDFHKFTS